MLSFSYYFLFKELNDLNDSGMLSESVEPFTKNGLNKFLNEIKDKLLAHFSEKFPKVQHEDIEEVFIDAKQEIENLKVKNSKLARKKIKQIMTKNLMSISKKKNGVKKNLSCVKVIKKTLNCPEQLTKLMKRAEKLLTTQEKKVLNLCTQGKSVRTIGIEMKISAPTAWRALNSAIDKIRLSHGMKSRYKDMR